MPSTETFQHYQVLKNPDGSLCELGRGAMGVTYKAFDTSLRCHVALKVINATYLNSEMAGQRFLREARAAAGLSHPNVASVFHLGEADGNYFYAMEYIDGETLESFVKRRGPLPPLTALKITLQVARALRAAARLGLVHRDIKPANLMLAREEEEGLGSDDDDLHVKVIDFGLAKLTRTDGLDASGTITVAGFVGTPHFASPEQLSEKDLDARSDIYSLGVTLWYMLAGRPPFSGSMVEVMSQQLTQRPPFERLPGVPPAVRHVLERMLEKDSSDRPQTPTDLRREIEQAISSLTGAPPAAPGESALTSGGPGSVPPRLEPGMVLEGRYQLMRRVSEDEQGILYQATELETVSTVALRILAPALLPDAAAYERTQQKFGMAQGVSHPSLLRLFTLVRGDTHTFLTYEWVNGFPLLDVLRHRPVLSIAEVVRVLKPMAAASDTLHASGADGTDFEPGRVLLSYEAVADPDTQTALLSSTLVEWPACQPKVFPFRLRAEAGGHATWTGQQTMVPTQDGSPGGAKQLALLAYELLGGNVSQLQSTRRYSPLPTINEAGNEVLREQLLTRSGADQRADEFVGRLAATIDHRQASPSFHSAGAPESTRVTHLPATITNAALTAASPAPLPPPIRQSGTNQRFAIVAASLVLLLGVGSMAYIGWQSHKKVAVMAVHPNFSPLPATPPPQVVSTPTPRPTPTPSPTPEPTSTPTPPPTPAPTPMATAAPPVSEDRLAVALSRARALQDNRQIAEAFAAYVRIAEEFPESDEGLGRIDSYISALEAEPLAAEPEQRRFQQVRASLERAAGIGSDLAMLFLANHLRATEPEAAADWYRRAVEKGRPEAMEALGDMYFAGVGVPLDPSQTAHWYQMASDKGYVKAKVKLAECYEMGKGGVERNVERSFRLLNEALGLEPDDTHALEKLGLAYEYGRGTAPDARRAFSLMKHASDLGNINAKSILGAYYMKGLGTTRDEKLGVSLFKEAADKDNAVAMFYYAQCLRGGLGGLNANSAQAVNYYRAAAERGFVPAREYCQKNGIRFVPRN